MDTDHNWRDQGVRIVRHDQLDTNMPQTPRMLRAAAIAKNATGASKTWAGAGTFQPNATTGPHHQGEKSTAWAGTSLDSSSIAPL